MNYKKFMFTISFFILILKLEIYGEVEKDELKLNQYEKRYNKSKIFLIGENHNLKEHIKIK